MSSTKEMHDLGETFKRFDINGDGLLSKEELVKGYTSYYGNNSKAIMIVDGIFERVDLNKDGHIDFSGKIPPTMTNSRVLDGQHIA